MNYIDVAAGVIVNDQKEFLVTRRGPGQAFEGKWEFPGGKIEVDEIAENCLVREIREELGMDINIRKPFHNFSYNYGRPDNKIHRFFVFLCDSNSMPKLSVHDDFKWAKKENLPQLDFLDADRELIEKIQNEL